tara:strand:- start:45 stop:812 length:768 start_codon:yes stop_codon:yes gene_type:complete
MGKTKIAREISEVLHRVCAGTTIRTYAEPFCGMVSVGLRMIEKSTNGEGNIRHFLFSDHNQNIIVLLQAIQRGWTSPTSPIETDEWQRLKRTTRISARRSFYGYGLGFSGALLRGSKPNTRDNTVKHLTSVRRKIKRIQGGGFSQQQNVSIVHSDFRTRNYRNTLIYCDPPYIGVGETNTSTTWPMSDEDDFYRKIYEWLDPKLNNIVVISGMIRPKRRKGFSIRQIWKKNWRVPITTQRLASRNEYLFRVRRHT